jgi:hypothetical protein
MESSPLQALFALSHGARKYLTAESKVLKLGIGPYPCLANWLSLTLRLNLPVDNSQNRTSKAKNLDAWSMRNDAANLSQRCT